MKNSRSLIYFCSALLAACSFPADSGSRQQSAQPPEVAAPLAVGAFPGAMGFGAAARGGHGGKIIPVVTIADSGPGSLRECIEAAGPRVCVFRTAGTIRFNSQPPVIRNPYLTIAGQTAPGEGITLAHAGGSQGRTPLVVKKTHDIIIRHIRVRPDIPGEERGAEDGVTIEDSRRVIIDHVSASWARDELVNGFADNDEITISNSIFAAGIPPHDKCALLASDPEGPQSVSFIRNICAHNGDRNPDINFPPGSCVEVVNNLFYNAQSEFAEIWESEGGSPVSLVGNLFIAGPDTSRTATGVVRAGIAATGDGQAYLWDNLFEGDFQHISPAVNSILVDRPPCKLTLVPQPASELVADLLATSGTWPRDSFDVGVVREIGKRKGRIGQKPSPPVPGPANAAPYADRDGDGMDDEWELRHGADPDQLDTWADADGNGIADFEDFLTFREVSAMRGRPHGHGAVDGG